MGCFKRDFAHGKRGEAAVTNLLDKSGIKWAESKPLSSWDLEIEVGGRSARIECKYDKMSARTGNLAIEHWNSKKDKPSGITATEADIWVVVLDPGPQVFAASVESLRKFCKNNPPLRSVHGGDGNSHMWLYRVEQIVEEIFTPLDEVSSDKLGEVIVLMLT